MMILKMKGMMKMADHKRRRIFLNLWAAQTPVLESYHLSWNLDCLISTVQLVDLFLDHELDCGDLLWGVKMGKNDIQWGSHCRKRVLLCAFCQADHIVPLR